MSYTDPASRLGRAPALLPSSRLVLGGSSIWGLEVLEFLPLPGSTKRSCTDPQGTVSGSC